VVDPGTGCKRWGNRTGYQRRVVEDICVKTIISTRRAKEKALERENRRAREK
jgi:hypothetical protein